MTDTFEPVVHSLPPCSTMELWYHGLVLALVAVWTSEAASLGKRVSNIVCRLDQDFRLQIGTKSKSFNSVGRNISALVGCIKTVRALYEVQLLETF